MKNTRSSEGPGFTPRWFHGGTPDLKAGAWLLPPAETGYRKGRNDAAQALGIDAAAWLGPDVDRDDRVYLTTSRRQALAFAMAAVFNPRGPAIAWGALYTAEPDGIQEPDPDLPDTPDARFIQVPRARILAVYNPVVLPDPAFCVRVLGEAISAGTWQELAALAEQAREG